MFITCRPNEVKNLTDNTRTAFYWYRIAIQAVPAAVIGIYLAGFVVINARLSKYQLLDLDLFNARYVISGTHLAIFLGLWYMFVGQSTISKDSFGDSIRENKSYGYLFCDSIRHTYSICVLTAFYSSILQGSTELFTFLIYSVALFFLLPHWENWWESGHRYKRFPILDIYFVDILRSIGVAIFFWNANFLSHSTLLFLQFVVISIYSTVVRNSIEYFQQRSEQFSWVLFHGIFFLLLTTISFGWLQYEKINSSFGGGQLQLVEVTVTDDKVIQGLVGLGFENGPSFEFNLVHENQEILIFTDNERTIQLSKSAIADIRSHNIVLSNWMVYFDELFYRLLRAWETVFTNK